ncbi:MAG: hypothetical protein AAF297_06750, partial [Planctomycetota bacterium]
MSDGLISTSLDFGPVFTGQRQFLEVSVRRTNTGSYSALPRQQVFATPNAVFAKAADVAASANFAMTSGTTLTDAFRNGNVLDVGGSLLGLEDTLFGGRIDVDVGDAGGFNSMQFYGEDSFLYLAEDSDGGGAFLQLGNAPDTPFGFEVDGNDGANNTRVSIDGMSSSFFLTGFAGNGSVLLPPDAIGPSELFGEAGIASRHVNNLSASITSSATSVFQRTITAPVNGYIVAIFSGEFFVNHDPGSNTRLVYGLATNPGVFEKGLEYAFDIDASVTGFFPNRSVTVHATFPVSAGSTTIHFNISQAGGNTGGVTDLIDAEMTLLFVPTAYGLVGTGGNRPALGVEDGAAFASPVTNAERIREQSESIEANRVRVDAELAAFRAEVDAMRAQRLRDRA